MRRIGVVLIVLAAAQSAAAQTSTTISTSVTYDGSIAPYGYSQSPGILVIDGAGSPVLTLTNSATSSGVQGLYFGTTSGNSGGLDVFGGSLFTNLGDASLGAVAGSTGSAVVNGSGSAWSNSGNIYVGGINSGAGGTGSLTVNSNGMLNVGGTLKLWNAGTLTLDTGGAITTTNFDATTGTFNFNGGTLTVSGGTYTASNSTLVINGTNAPVLVLSAGATTSGVNNVTVGNSNGSSGALAILNGATLSISSELEVANVNGSSGTITVSAANLTVSNLDVGRAGTGSLYISNGGVVSSTFNNLGSLVGSGTGSAVVTGTGSTWNANTFALKLGEFNGSYGTLSILNGGVVNAAGVDVGGFSGSQGLLTILNGGLLNSSGADIAGSGGAVDAATVSGAGSTWNAGTSSTFYVGDSGTGSLLVSGGAALISGTAYIGNSSGASGTATLSGASTWSDSGNLALGGSSNFAGGSGFLTVTGSSTLSVAGTLTLWSGGLLAIGGSSGVTAATISGTGGTVTLSGGTLSISGTGTNTISGLNGSGTIAFSQSNTQLQIIGGSFDGAINGLGNLTISGVTTFGPDATFTSSTSVISGSFHLMNSLAIGSAAAASSLAIQGGITTIDGLLQLTSGGTLSVSGGGLAAPAIDVSAGTFSFTGGTITVSGGTYTQLPGPMTINGTGDPTLVLAGGATFSGVTTLTVGGTAGAFHDTSNMTVGAAGLPSAVAIASGGVMTVDGVLQAGAGGTLSLGQGGLIAVQSFDSTAPGAFSFSGGMLQISGGIYTQSGSVLVKDGANNPTLALTAGGTIHALGSSTAGVAAVYLGTTSGNAGSLEVFGGTTLTDSGNAYLGYVAGATGSAIISGTGAQWANSGDLYVGVSGGGILTITAAGMVSSANGYLGFNAGSSGSATVAGSGSTWSVASNLYIGGSSTASGAATLAVTNSGVLSVGGTLKLWNSGTLTLDTAGAITTTNFDATTGAFNFNGGTLTVSGGTYTSLGALTINGANSPTLVLAGGATMSGVTALTVGGTSGAFHDTSNLALGSAGAPGSMTVQSGGVATIDGVLQTTAGSTLSLGSGGAITATNFDASTGTFNFTGGTFTISGGTYTQSLGGLTINGADDPTLVLAGGATMSGVTTLTVGGTAGAFRDTSSLSLGSAGAPATLALQPGGTATINGLLQVGAAGTLLLDGGLLTAQAFDVSGGTLSFAGGTLLINSTFTQSSSVLVIDGANNPTLALTAGGTIYALGSSTSGVTAVYLGTNSGNAGSLEVFGSTTLTNSGTAYLGVVANSAGGATVSGTGAIWTNTGDMYVGASGSGNLTVTAGGVLSSANGYLGFSSGANGNATISGALSKWALSGNLDLGGSTTASGGTAAVVVSSSGTLTVGGTLTLWNQGTLTLNGGGAITATNFDATTGTFNFNGGTLTVSGGTYTQSAGALTINGTNNPTLVLAGGATLSGVTAFTVGGTSGGFRDASSLTLGSAGAPLALAVQNGGAVSVAGTLQMLAGSTLTLSGGTLGVSSLNASAGTLNFSGGTLTVTQGPYVQSSGPLTINGANSPTLVLAVGATLSGVTTLTVGGTSGGFHDTTTLTLGGTGAPASLAVQAGGAVTIDGRLGFAGSANTLTLAGGSLSVQTLSHTVGTLNFTGGTLTVTGGSFIQPNGTLTLNGANNPTLVLANNATLSGVTTLTVGGTDGGFHDTTTLGLSLGSRVQPCLSTTHR
ncbi:MAG TPA: hypothetical protein VHZ24_18210 [Pirellulales bacterium]|jgi:T5SS/PEP-CTERM-associated repeat protein|nr:hypothetical protein [Pirellulales bacterium]